MLKLIADSHNTLHTTELDIFFIFSLSVCFIIAFYIKKLIENEDNND